MQRFETIETFFFEKIMDMLDTMRGKTSDHNLSFETTVFFKHVRCGLIKGFHGMMWDSQSV